LTFLDISGIIVYITSVGLHSSLRKACDKIFLLFVPMCIRQLASVPALTGVVMYLLFIPSDDKILQIITELIKTENN
jgi:isocitrate dehydrogenase kinase/phosphatase